MVAQLQVVSSRGTLHVGQQLTAMLESTGCANVIRSAALVDSETQQRQAAAAAQQAGLATRVLAAAQQRWQGLLVERLRATQSLLPGVQLVAPPRSSAELQGMRAEGVRGSLLACSCCQGHSLGSCGDLVAAGAGMRGAPSAWSLVPPPPPSRLRPSQLQTWGSHGSASAARAAHSWQTCVAMS